MKKYFFIITLFLLTALGAAFFIRQRGGGLLLLSPTPTSIPTPAPSQNLFRGINLVTQQADEVLSFLGAPQRTNQYKEVTTFIYKTEEPGRNISVEVTTNNTVKRIIEPIFSGVTFSSVVSTMGSPTLILYGLLENLGFRLYVFSNQGVAYLANPETQEVREQWYFPPTGASQFLGTLGEGFSTEHDTQKP